MADKSVTSWFKNVFDSVRTETDEYIESFFGDMTRPDAIVTKKGEPVKIDSSRGIVTRPLSSTERLKEAENVAVDLDRSSVLEKKYVKKYFDSYSDLIKSAGKSFRPEDTSETENEYSKYRDTTFYGGMEDRLGDLKLDVPKDLRGIFKDKDQWNTFKETIHGIESNVKDYGAEKGKYTGRFMMGPSALSDAREYDSTLPPVSKDKTSRQMFKDDPNLQERYYAAFVQANHKRLMKLDSYKKLSSDDKIAALGFAQQGYGNTKNYIEKGIVSVDGNGVKGTKYVDALVKEMGLNVTSAETFANIYNSKPLVPRIRPKKTERMIKPILRPIIKKRE